VAGVGASGCGTGNPVGLPATGISNPVGLLLGTSGLSAADLLERGGFASGYTTLLAAGELHDWLVESGFAEDGDGLLRPTMLGLEVGSALTRDESDRPTR
jgi:hypothetical protein